MTRKFFHHYQTIWIEGHITVGQNKNSQKIFFKITSPFSGEIEPMIDLSFSCKSRKIKSDFKKKKFSQNLPFPQVKMTSQKKSFITMTKYDV